MSQKIPFQSTRISSRKVRQFIMPFFPSSLQSVTSSRVKAHERLVAICCKSSLVSLLPMYDDIRVR